MTRMRRTNLVSRRDGDRDIVQHQGQARSVPHAHVVKLYCALRGPVGNSIGEVREGGLRFEWMGWEEGVVRIQVIAARECVPVREIKV